MDEVTALRWMVRIHGHLGWLSVLALCHPAWLLRKNGGRKTLSALLATLLTTVTFAAGLWLYPAYRSRLKHAIFVEAPSIGWAFERKEHLALGVVCFAWVGLLAHALAGRSPRDASARPWLERLAWGSYVFAALGCAGVAVLGMMTAVQKSF